MSLHCLSLSPLLAFKNSAHFCQIWQMNGSVKRYSYRFYENRQLRTTQPLRVICQWLATVHISQRINTGRLLASCNMCCRLYSCLARRGRWMESEGGYGGHRRELQILRVMFRAHLGREQQLVGEGLGVFLCVLYGWSGENPLLNAVGLMEGERPKSLGIEASYKSSGFFFCLFVRNWVEFKQLFYTV